MSTHQVFVYGTLLAGESNAVLLKGSKKVSSSPVYVYGKLYDLGAFPGLKEAGIPSSDRSNLVKGEVYSVDDATLESLDRLEGYRGPEHHESNFYNQVKVPALNIYGEQMISSPVIVYEYNGDVSPDGFIRNHSWVDRHSPPPTAKKHEVGEEPYLDFLATPSSLQPLSGATTFSTTFRDFEEDV